MYSASNIDVPKEIIKNVQSRLFKFLWKNKGDKIKILGVYQDYEKGGLRVSYLETVIKALRLAWIPRLLNNGHPNWKTVPNYHLKKWGGLDFLLWCNYRTGLETFRFPTLRNLKISQQSPSGRVTFRLYSLGYVFTRQILPPPPPPPPPPRKKYKIK